MFLVDQYRNFDLTMCEDCKIPDEQRLLIKLLRGYETASRPVYNASHSVTIKYGLTLVQISDMVSHVIELNECAWAIALVSARSGQARILHSCIHIYVPQRKQKRRYFSFEIQENTFSGNIFVLS